MADRSAVVRMRAEVSEFKRGLQDAAKATDELADKADAAGKAIDAQADAAARAAKAAGYAKDAQGRWRDEKGKFVTVAERERLGLDKTTESTTKATGALQGLAKSARDNRAEWQTMGATFATAGAAIGGGLALATREAIRWESAWAGVQKTTDGSPEQMARLEGELRQLATTLPSTHEEIAAVAEAAGQLGVAREDIASFTRTAIDLGETTNLSADEAATSLAQLMNVMQTAPEDVGRLGAALVELGNNGASTEAEILNLASYVSGAGQLIGATESDVLALANTMASLGINAERGGGVMTRTLQDIYVAVQNGGSSLEDFAQVAGMSGDEFARAFGEDPIRAVAAFTDGLAGAKANGDNVVAILNDLGIKGTQDTAVLLQMAGAQGMLTESLDMGNAAWEANNALTDEAEKRYETTAAKLQVARNQFNDAAIDLGVTFLPVLTTAAETVGGLANAFAGLPEPLQGVIGELGGVAAITATGVGAFALFVPRVLEAKDALQRLAPKGSQAADVLGDIGKAAGQALAIYAVTKGIVELAEAAGDAGESMRDNALVEGIERVAEGDLSALNAQFDNFGDSLVRTAPEVDGFAGALDRMFDKTVDESVLDWMQGVEEKALGTRSEITQLEERFAGLDTQLAAMVEGDRGEAAAQFFEQMTAYAKEQGYSIEELNALFPTYGDALLGAKQAQDEAAASGDAFSGSTRDMIAAAGDVAPTLADAYASWEGWITYHRLSEDAVDALRGATDDFAETLTSFVDPFGTYSDLLQQKQDKERAVAEETAAATDFQEDSWEDYVTNASLSLNEWIGELEKQQTAQQNWSDNLVRLSAKASEEVVQMFVDAGPESAAALQQLVDSSGDELARLEPIARDYAAGAAFGMADEINRKKDLVNRIASEFGSGAASAAAEELAAGTKTIEQIATDYGYALAAGVNPILTGVGKGPIRLGAKPDAVREFFTVKNADGNLMEDHRAQIAQGGSVHRVWAEPETGGEAYIPLHPTKRARSLDIWRETGKRLGALEQYGEKYLDGGIRAAERFANGGFSSGSAVPRVPSTDPSRPPISTAAQGVMNRARTDIASWVDAQVAAAAASAMGDVGGPVPSPGPGGWARPGRGGRVSSEFGMRFHPIRRVNRLHNGIDVAGLAGSRVLAAQSGRVRFSGSQGSYGNVVFIRHAGGTETGYAHLARRAVQAGDTVNRGQLVGIEGATGGVTGKHLHFNVRRGGGFVNPRSIIRFADGGITKGGVLNPHIRDKGGPLLPGFTLNATGAAENVIPHGPITAPSASAGSGGPVRIVGTLDLGNGLVGLMDGVATQVVGTALAERDRAAATKTAYRMGE